MRWPLSRGWTFIIIAASIPIIIWFVLQLWQSAQTGKFGTLPKLEILTNSYTFNNQIIQEIGRSNSSVSTSLRKVYKIERRVGDPTDFLRRLGVAPVTVNSTVNAYQNKDTQLLITHDKSTNTLVILPEASDQAFHRDSADNEQEAIERCRSVIDGLEVLNDQDFASAQTETSVQGGAFRVLFWRTINKEVVWYSAGIPALADCSVMPDGKVVGITIQLDELSVVGNSLYRSVALAVSASNIVTNDWPFSIDLILSPQDVENNYTVSPSGMRSVTIDETKNVSLVFCKQEECYTYPGYQVKATAQIVSTGLTTTYPGYARLYLPSLDPQYWK